VKNRSIPGDSLAMRECKSREHIGNRRTAGTQKGTHREAPGGQCLQSRLLPPPLTRRGHRFNPCRAHQFPRLLADASPNRRSELDDVESVGWNILGTIWAATSAWPFMSENDERSRGLLPQGRSVGRCRDPAYQQSWTTQQSPDPRSQPPNRMPLGPDSWAPSTIVQDAAASRRVSALSGRFLLHH